MLLFCCTLYDYGIHRLNIRPFGLLPGVCQAVLYLDSLSFACLTINHNTERKPNKSDFKNCFISIP